MSIWQLKKGEFGEGFFYLTFFLPGLGAKYAGACMLMLMKKRKIDAKYSSW